ncbi:Ergosterol biosynthesis ERG4/ERG24 family protein [Aspergillus parasiticus SU-1]|uniref:7-dehydrocholesterol reductase n=1 Tax=Aspergillus parasiticus (strain ATCC 56775 / NRRL 5862 / SRRC 143 / SU-1) TaxID=1403190 RepID=A0A0F0IKX3_ASPPU|nr:Ergosterol biosynthesis ERG4/ERG24 family protein [Aspergillus parasiticus SU-1]
MQKNASLADDHALQKHAISHSIGYLPLMLFITPLTSIWWGAITDHNGSLQLSVTRFLADPTESLSWYSLPSHDIGVAFAKWIFFEAILYTVLPGRVCAGQPTPSGHNLPYTMNGLSFIICSVISFLLAAALGWTELSFIAKNWRDVILAANVFAWLLTGLAFVKGRMAPSYKYDTRENDSYISDIWRGIELHPRFGAAWDLKIFHNRRWTIAALAMIDISFAALQWEIHGYITCTMICVMLLRNLLTVNLFVNEEWYLYSTDVCDEPFGFYFAWGSGVFFPTIYTLQTQYLAMNPVELPLIHTISILSLGVMGFMVYYIATEQKKAVCDTKGVHDVGDEKAQFIRASYKTTDGVERESLLLCSGPWKHIRHPNYLGLLVLTYAMCGLCGTGALLPWTEAAFATAFLAYRCTMDERNCVRKYGKDWEVYCRRVRWRLVPGLY